ncbi:ATP-binding cassette sub- B member 9, partial [Quaeritorhiza haematococci]
MSGVTSNAGGTGGDRDVRGGDSVTVDVTSSDSPSANSPRKPPANPQRTVIALFLLFETVFHLFLFLLSGISLDPDASYARYLYESIVSDILYPGYTIFDLVLLSLFKNVVIVLFVYLLARTRPQTGPVLSDRKTYSIRIGLYIWLLATLIASLAKAIWIGNVNGTKTFPVSSFFVYGLIFLSLLFTFIELVVALRYTRDFVRVSGEYVAVPTNPGAEGRVGGDSTSASGSNVGGAEGEGKEKKDPVKFSKVPWKRLWGLLRPDLNMIIVGLLALTIGTMTGLAIPFYFGKVVDAVGSHILTIHLALNTSPSPTEPPTIELLTNVVSVLFAIFALGGLSSFIRNYAFTITGYRIVRRLRIMVFRSIIVQEIGFFDETKTGDLLSRLSSDTQALQSGLTANISMTVRSLADALGALIIMFGLSWKLTLVMFSSVPVVVLGAIVYGRYIRSLQKTFQDKLAEAGSIAQEVFTPAPEHLLLMPLYIAYVPTPPLLPPIQVISQIRTVRSFAKEDHSQKLYEETVDASYRVGVTITTLGAIFNGLMGFFPQAAIALVLYYGGLLVIRREISGGLLTSFLLYTLNLAMSFGVLSGVWGSIMQALGASQRIFHLIDERVPKIPVSGGITIPNFQGRITFKDVTFSYPTRPESQVLKGVSLELEPGMRLALVGPSGQ